MALSKEIVVDKIEVLEKGNVQVRTATRVLEDGVELSSAFHRHVLQPLQKMDNVWIETDLTNEDAKVVAICNASWTQAVKDAYKFQQDAK